MSSYLGNYPWTSTPGPRSRAPPAATRPPHSDLRRRLDSRVRTRTQVVHLLRGRRPATGRSRSYRLPAGRPRDVLGHDQSELFHRFLPDRPSPLPSLSGGSKPRRLGSSLGRDGESSAPVIPVSSPRSTPDSLPLVGHPTGRFVPESSSPQTCRREETERPDWRRRMSQCELGGPWKELPHRFQPVMCK